MKKIIKVIAVLAAFGMMASFTGCDPAPAPATDTTKNTGGNGGGGGDPDPTPDPAPKLREGVKVLMTELGVDLTTLETTQLNTASLAEVVNIKDFDAADKKTAYKVTDFDGLKKLAEIVNTTDETFEGVTITQDANIVVNKGLLADDYEIAVEDPSVLVAFDGIGKMSDSFKGTYDGNNGIIYGLYVYGEQQGLGFFGSTNGATIKNLNLVDAIVVNGNKETKDDEKNPGRLTHDGHDDDRFGGIVGLIEGATNIENCIYLGTVGSKAAKANGDGDFTNNPYEYVGGICGRCDAASTMKNCIAFVYNVAGEYPLVKKGADKFTTFENCVGYDLDSGEIQIAASGVVDYDGSQFVAIYNNPMIKTFMDYLGLDVSSPDPTPTPDPDPTPTPDPE